jgi:hypothetical protein
MADTCDGCNNWDKPSMSVLATSIVKDQTQLAVLWQADA